MKKLIPLFCVLTALFLETTYAVAQPCQNVKQAAERIHSKITDIIDFQTLKLENGKTIRLANLHFPFQSFERLKKSAHTSSSPVTEKKVQTLLNQFIGQAVSYPKDARQNRYDQFSTQLFLDQDEPAQEQENPISSLQEFLISKGMALFYTLDRHTACASLWLQGEQKARQDKTGLWANPQNAILAATPAQKLNWETQKFQIIEGKILNIGQTRRQIYLNFEANWRTDFTISISRNDLWHVVKKGVKLVDLKGRKIRVRGWLEWRNGPMMPLTSEDNLELLD